MEKNREERSKKVEEILIKYNFNLASKGFNYWITAVEIAKKNPNWRIGNIYEEIANTYNTNYKQVEKRMRESRVNSTIEEKYKRKNLRNSEVLRLLIIEERRM